MLVSDYYVIIDARLNVGLIAVFAVYLGNPEVICEKYLWGIFGYVPETYPRYKDHRDRHHSRK